VRLPKTVEGEPSVLWTTTTVKDRYYASPVLHDGVLYASVETDAIVDPDSEMLGLHLWARARREEEQLVLWAPVPSTFRELVAEGVLPGDENERNDIVLESLGEEALATLQGERAADLFVWDEPFALIRISPAR